MKIDFLLNAIARVKYSLTSSHVACQFLSKRNLASVSFEVVIHLDVSLSCIGRCPSKEPATQPIYHSHPVTVVRPYFLVWITIVDIITRGKRTFNSLM